MPSYIKDGSQKRGATFNIRSQSGLPVIDENYSWIVIADSPLVPVDVITNTPGLPRVNVTQSPNGLGVCRAKTGEQWKDKANYWTVNATFSSAVDERSSIQDPSINPVTWVPIYETKFERLQEVVTKDKSDRAIANSAGQPFETGLTISRFIPVWEFFQLENPITDEDLIARNETINETPFKGRAAETLLLTVMSSVVGFYYGQRRRLTQYSLKYNKRKWTHNRLDVGNVYKLSTKLVPYTDDNGNVILGGLNGFGAKVAVGDPPFVLSFDMYDKLNFNPFLRV
jgi:hypothetical protein